MKKNLIIIILAILAVVLSGTLVTLTLIKKPIPTQQLPSKSIPANQAVTEPANQPPPQLVQATCNDAENAPPTITSLSTFSGTIGTKLEIIGCNFSGFEGDKNTWIVNAAGVKGLLDTNNDESTDTLIKTVLTSPLCQDNNNYRGVPCENFLVLKPGIYKIYEEAWGKESNRVTFTIK